MKLADIKGDLEGRFFRRKFWSTGAIATWEKGWKYQSEFGSPDALSVDNKNGNDWYECDKRGEHIEPPADKTVLMYDFAKQRKARIKSINKNLREETQLPDILDQKAWERMAQNGFKVEASYVNRDNWNQATTQGASFRHPKGDVRFRLMEGETYP